MAVTKELPGNQRTSRRKMLPPVKRGLSFWLGFLTIATILTITLAYAFGFISASVHLCLMIPVYYFLAMCLHDAIHKAAHQKRRWNRTFGWLCAALFGLTFPTIRRAHLRHHSAFGHDHHDDVESFIYRASWGLVPRLLVVNWKCYAELATARFKERLLATILVGSIIVATFCFPRLMLVGWLIPMQIALGAFALMTVYLPHGRYSKLIMQNIPSVTGFHDDHHDLPQYPWYQYFGMRRRKEVKSNWGWYTLNLLLVLISFAGVEFIFASHNTMK